MTGKRFTTKNIICSNYCIWDNNDKPYGNDEVVELLNKLHEENSKIKSILLKRVEELDDAYNKSAKAGMPTGGIIGELDSFEEICEIMGWIE